MTLSTTEVMDQLNRLVTEAKTKRLYIHGRYQDLWFSPVQFQEALSQGRFHRDPTNYTLRDPREHLNYLKWRVERGQVEVEQFKLELRVGGYL